MNSFTQPTISLPQSEFSTLPKIDSIPKARLKLPQIRQMDPAVVMKKYTGPLDVRSSQNGSMRDPFSPLSNKGSKVETQSTQFMTNLNPSTATGKSTGAGQYDITTITGDRSMLPGKYGTDSILDRVPGQSFTIESEIARRTATKEVLELDSRESSVIPLPTLKQYGISDDYKSQIDYARKHKRNMGVAKIQKSIIQRLDTSTEPDEKSQTPVHQKGGWIYTPNKPKLKMPKTVTKQSQSLAEKLKQIELEMRSTASMSSTPVKHIRRKRRNLSQLSQSADKNEKVLHTEEDKRYSNLTPKVLQQTVKVDDMFSRQSINNQDPQNQSSAQKNPFLEHKQKIERVHKFAMNDEMKSLIESNTKKIDEIIRNKRRQQVQDQGETDSQFKTDKLFVIDKMIESKRQEILKYLDQSNLQEELGNPLVEEEEEAANQIYHTDGKEIVSQQTASFLNEMLKDAHVSKTKSEYLNKMRDQLVRLLKDRLKLLGEDEENQSCDVLKTVNLGLESINMIRFKTRLKKRVQSQILEEKIKFRSRIPQLIRKHLFKPKSKLDIFYVNGALNMQQKLLNMFDIENPGTSDSCLGSKYKAYGLNAWSLENQPAVIQRLFGKKALASGNQHDTLNKVFHEEALKMEYYNLAKGRYNAEKPEVQERMFNHFENCKKRMVVPVPAYVKIKDQQLYLTQSSFSDEMAENLKEFLVSQKSVQSYQIKLLCIDDCGMTDFQFSKILEGHKEQGSYLQSIIYSAGQLGELSCKNLVDMIPQITDLQLTNLQGSSIRTSLFNLVQALNDVNMNLRKLKISKTNINDQRIVEKICQMIENKENLISLDLSWACLSSKHMFMITKALNEHDHVLMNLNLGYNSLNFNEPTGEYKEIFYNSEDCFEQLCEYLQKSLYLIHIDLSGLSFQREQLKVLCPILVQINSLVAVHLSGMGLHKNEENQDDDLMVEILNYFGISDDFDQKPKQNINQYTKKPDELREVIRNTYKYNQSDDKQVQGAEEIQKQIMMIKQSKIVNTHKIKNQAIYGHGIGRLEAMPDDVFVVTRKTRMPELIFNNNRSKDLYWEVEAGETWQLSHSKNPTNECFLCQKHKYAMIYVDKVYQNEELEEIKDPLLISKVKASLNLNDQCDEYAPVICGSVIDGGFKRKLQMLRSDFYSILSMCQSEVIIRAGPHERAIKKGMGMIVTRTQDVFIEGVGESLRGWQIPLRDKTLQNECYDVQAVNFPEEIKNYVDPGIDKSSHQWKPVKPCSSFVYSAFIGAGHHQFLIYMPERTIHVREDEKPGQLLPGGLRDKMIIPARLFVKSMIVDISQFEQYLSAPIFVKQGEVKKKTISNVWRAWKQDDADMINHTLTNDVNGDFDCTLFMKDPNDVQNAYDIIKNNWKLIQCCFQDQQASTFLYHEKNFPQVNFFVFLQSILGVQKTDKQKKALSRANVELCFQRATRGDDGSTLQGALCRGEFLETFLRIVKHFNQSEKKISTFIKGVLEEYFEPFMKESKVVSVRKQIHSHKQLNAFLFSNLVGLQMIFDKYRNAKGIFNYQSVKAFFPKLAGITDVDQTKFMKLNFIYCQMTRDDDLNEPHKYYQICFVEFLDFLCRMAIDYFTAVPRQDAKDLEDMAHELLKLIWEREKPKVQPKAPAKADKGTKRDRKPVRQKKEQTFPELEPPVFEDSDEY